MSFKGCDYTINVVSDTDTTAIQNQVNANTAAIAELDTRLDADELQIAENKDNVASIGYNVCIPALSFPQNIVIGDQGTWFNTNFGNPVVLAHSGKYMVSASFTSCWHSDDSVTQFNVGTGMNLLDPTTQIACVLGSSSIISTFRFSDWTGAGVQLQMIVDLVKNTEYTVACFLNYGGGRNISFIDGFNDEDASQWPRPRINEGYSGINFTLLSAS
jgi:hypothetical protein